MERVFGRDQNKEDMKLSFDFFKFLFFQHNFINVFSFKKG